MIHEEFLWDWVSSFSLRQPYAVKHLSPLSPTICWPVLICGYVLFNGVFKTLCNATEVQEDLFNSTAYINQLNMVVWRVSVGLPTAVLESKFPTTNRLVRQVSWRIRRTTSGSETSQIDEFCRFLCPILSHLDRRIGSPCKSELNLEVDVHESSWEPEHFHWKCYLVLMRFHSFTQRWLDKRMRVWDRDIVLDLNLKSTWVDKS